MEVGHEGYRGKDPSPQLGSFFPGGENLSRQAQIQIWKGIWFGRKPFRCSGISIHLPPTTFRLGEKKKVLWDLRERKKR